MKSLLINTRVGDHLTVRSCPRLTESIDEDPTTSNMLQRRREHHGCSYDSGILMTMIAASVTVCVMNGLRGKFFGQSVVNWGKRQSQKAYRPIAFHLLHNIM
jgi:hypothetical protein